MACLVRRLFYENHIFAERRLKYYYKGGYFHGIHYGSFFDDSEALLSIMKEEETFLFNSPERRRILIDLLMNDRNMKDSCHICWAIMEKKDRELLL